MSHLPPYQFPWPNPQAPRLVTRDLTLIRTHGKRTARSRRIPLQAVTLIELVAQCLYEVPPKAHSRAGEIPELAPGCILSARVPAKKKLEGPDPPQANSYCFVSYPNLFEARRGVAYTDRRFRHTVPAHPTWSGSLDELIRTPWQVQEHHQGAQVVFVLVGLSTSFKPHLPILSFRTEPTIAKRIHTVRGIGRTLSFREAVLEHYTDRCRETCAEAMRSQAYRLREEWLAHGTSFANDVPRPPTRTPKLVRKEADQLLAAVQRLQAFPTHPFSRVFSTCAQDLLQAVGFLHQAASERNGSMLGQAKGLFAKAYRALVVLECHVRLQELLLQVRILHDRQEPLLLRQQQVWHEELNAVHHHLTSPDPLTRKPLEHDLPQPVLPRVVSHVHLADVNLMAHNGGPDLVEVQAELALACEPL